MRLSFKRKYLAINFINGGDFFLLLTKFSANKTTLQISRVEKKNINTDQRTSPQEILPDTKVRYLQNLTIKTKANNGYYNVF